jgi:hypothetical protein
MRGSVNKERTIMNTSRKASSSDHRSKKLELSTRSLLEAIKPAAKMTYHTLRDRIPRWWLYIHFLTEFTIKKGILHIKLRYRPLTNRSHNKKSVNSGHMSHRCKYLIIVPTMLPLKTTRYKMSFVALKRTIRAGLNLVNPLTSDRMDIYGNRYKIQCASALKSSNLLCHSMLPLLMMNGITVRSRLRKNSTSKTKPIWMPNRLPITESISWRTRIRSCLIKRRRCIGRRWLIRRRRRNMAPQPAEYVCRHV